MVDYRALKVACMSRGQLYEDPDFPALASSISTSKRIESSIRWARPKVLCDNPDFFCTLANKWELEPGLADNSAFATAASVLVMKPTLFKKVVPPGQDFGARYIGIFHFNLWWHGQWREVIVDDRLPVRDKMPAFCRNRKQTTEYWCALLEKAYAKLHGTYEALETLSTKDILVDLTGGIGDVIDMPSRPPKGLYNVMAIFSTRNTLMACTIPAGGSKHGDEQKKGLRRGATYVICDVTEREIAGACNKEKTVSFTDRRNASDRLPYRIWKKHFDELTMCHLTAGQQLGEEGGRNWYINSEGGRWVIGDTAGGSGNPPEEDLYWKNPQFSLSVKGAGSAGQEQIVLVSLIQWQPGESDAPAPRRSIAIDVYKFCQENQSVTGDGPIGKSALQLTRSTETYSDEREITLRTTLPVGHYVIIPSTYHAGEGAHFLLRVVTEARAQFRTLSGQIRTEDYTKTNWQRESKQPAPSRASCDSRSVDKYKSVSLYSDPRPEAEPLALVTKKQEPLQAPVQRIPTHSFSKTMDAYDIQQILTVTTRRGLCSGEAVSLEACRNILTMADMTGSESVDGKRMLEIWEHIVIWEEVFACVAGDVRINMKCSELGNAFQLLGLRVGEGALRSLHFRYATKSNDLTFDDFLSCVARAKAAYAVFAQHRVHSSSNVCFTMDQWLEEFFK